MMLFDSSRPALQGSGHYTQVVVFNTDGQIYHALAVQIQDQDWGHYRCLETCAPGHGKGPWDRIGAVIKSLIRRLELHEKIYVQGARDVFLALLLHGTTARVGSRVSTSEWFVYHYVLLPGEPPLDGHAHVWPCIVRPSVHPDTTRIPGIRDAQRRAMSWPQELSCRCMCCRQYRWKDCKNEDAGEWRYVTMSSTPAAAVLSTRGQRAEISKQRRDMAKSVLSAK